MQALVLLVHPQLNKSRVNKALANAVRGVANITVHELYKEYPDFLIDVEREQQLLIKHELIVLQHPFYWYSAPALLKEWFDAVLEYGFAYGENGKRLLGKKLLSVVSTSGSPEAYQPKGSHCFTITELLRPFEQTAALCGMTFETPFLTQGIRDLDETALQRQALRYRERLTSYLQTGAR